MNIPPDKMYQTKDDIKNNIMVALGGRAAEEIIFGKNKITTGASNDLQRVTEMSLAMISRFGMDEEAGLINYEIALGNNLGSNPYVMDRTKVLISELYQYVTGLIFDNKKALEDIADNLLQYETMDEDQLDDILQSHNMLIAEEC